MGTNLLAVVLAALVALLGPCLAEGAPRPQGPVVLTVTGDVGVANRGPLDPPNDKLLETHNARFERAMEFDHAALVALGLHAVSVRYPTWPAGHRFEGPLLRDVLKAAGVTGGVVQPVALDGYAAEIPYADLERWPVILALKSDGRWLPLGGAGPAWVIYPRDDFPELAGQGDLKWVWGAFQIRAIREKE